MGAKKRQGDAAIREFAKLSPDEQRRVLGVAKTPEMLTDAEFCDLIRISPVTLRKHLRIGPSRRRFSAMGDIRLCPHVLIGGKRRWPREGVMKFLNNEQ